MSAVDFEALGRYHDAMKRARVALTERDALLGTARELLSQMLMPNDAEFVLAEYLLAPLTSIVERARVAETALRSALQDAQQTAAASGEITPAVDMFRSGAAPRATRIAESLTLTPTASVAHDPARTLDAGN